MYIVHHMIIHQLDARCVSVSCESVEFVSNLAVESGSRAAFACHWTVSSGNRVLKGSNMFPIRCVNFHAGAAAENQRSPSSALFYFLSGSPNTV